MSPRIAASHRCRPAVRLLNGRPSGPLPTSKEGSCSSWRPCAGIRPAPRRHGDGCPSFHAVDDRCRAGRGRHSSGRIALTELKIAGNLPDLVVSLWFGRQPPPAAHGDLPGHVRDLPRHRRVAPSASTSTPRPISTCRRPGSALPRASPASRRPPSRPAPPSSPAPPSTRSPRTWSTWRPSPACAHASASACR